jgi:hypothetical protein
MNEENRPVIKDKDLPDKPERTPLVNKATPASEKIDDGVKPTETDGFVDDLEDRLNNLFVESEVMSVPQAPAPKTSAALNTVKKRRSFFWCHDR